MILNVISGKGGTGKTLYCTTLADLLGSQGQRVIVVDMDFAVRGLTSLLYYYMGETFSIVDENKTTSYDLIESPNYRYENDSYKNLGITKYRTFDVLPAVSRINTRINLNPNIRREEYKERINFLFNILKNKYEYDIIILDCRAGYDELLSNLNSMSDISICIQEEDEISNITTVNLVRQLEEESDRPIFSIVNKARNISEEYLSDRNSKRNFRDFSFLGSIPFDMDVMSSFGEAYFWEKITKTMYFESVARTWNVLAKKMGKKEVFFERISPFPIKSYERRLGYLELKDRIVLSISLITGILGILLGVIGLDGIKKIIELNGEQILSIGLGLIGFIVAFYTIIKRSKRH